MLNLTSISNGTLSVICRRTELFSYVSGNYDNLNEVRAAWRVFLYNLSSGTSYFNWVDAWYAFVEYSKEGAAEYLIERLNADYDGALTAIQSEHDGVDGYRLMSSSIGHIYIYSDGTMRMQSDNRRIPVSVFLVDWEVNYQLTA